MASRIPTTVRQNNRSSNNITGRRVARPPSVVAGTERAESGRMVDMLKQLQTQVSALQAANASAPSKELEHLRRDNEKHRGDYEKIRNDNEKIRGDYEKIRGDYEKTRNDNEELRGENEKLRGENDALRMMLAETEQSLNLALQQIGSEPEESSSHASTRPSPTPQAAPVPVHRPYLPREEDEVDGSLSQFSDVAIDVSVTDHNNAHPGVNGVLGEVVELQSDNGGVESVSSKLDEMRAILELCAEREAYTTAALFTAIPGYLKLSEHEDLYTIWSSFGGDTNFAFCRSRLNVLQSLLSRYPGETLVLRPSAPPNSNWHGIIILEEEVSGFVSAMASRLPKLKTLRLVGYSAWPLSSEYYSSQHVPFASLQRLEVVETPWEPQVVIESLNALLERGQTSLKKYIITERLAPDDCNLVQFRKRFKGLLVLQ